MEIMEIEDATMFRDPNADNVTLVVEEREIVVSKVFLTLHSPYFEVLFYQDFAERNQSRIELKETNYYLFKELLYAIHLWNRPITINNVEGILEYADRYQMGFVTKKCEDFIARTRGLTKARKLLILDEYRLEKTKIQLISMLTFSEFPTLKGSEEYSHFSQHLKSALEDRRTFCGSLASYLLCAGHQCFRQVSGGARFCRVCRSRIRRG